MWAPAGIISFAEPIATPHLYTFSPALISQAATLCPMAIFWVNTTSRPSMTSRSPGRRGVTTTSTLSSRWIRKSFRDVPSVCINAPRSASRLEWDHSRYSVAPSCRSRFLTSARLGLQLVLELLRLAILHGLQMFTIKDQFSRHFEHLVRDFHHAQLRIFGPFFHLGADRVNRVSHKNGFDKSQLVVSVAEGMDIVVRHQTEAQAEHHSAGYQPPAKYALLLGEDLIRDIRMHVEHHGIEQHAFAFRDGASNGARTLDDFEVFIEPVFSIPYPNVLVFRAIGIGILHRVSLASGNLPGGHARGGIARIEPLDQLRISQVAPQTAIDFNSRSFEKA